MLAILCFFSGIACFTLAYLYYKCKLSVRWKGRGGYFCAPEKEEQKHPDFKAASRAQAFTVFLGGIAGILLGFYQLYHQGWIMLAVTIIGTLVVTSSVVFVLIFGRRAKRMKWPFLRITICGARCVICDVRYASFHLSSHIVLFLHLLSCVVHLDSSIYSFVSRYAIWDMQKKPRSFWGNWGITKPLLFLSFCPFSSFHLLSHIANHTSCFSFIFCRVSCIVHLDSCIAHHTSPPLSA